MKKLFFLAIACSALFAACDDDDDLPTLPPNEEELITTVNVQLTSSADSVTLTFQDLDGPGGDDPTISGGILRSNTAYDFVTTFLNESITPIEDITEEVRDEGTEHFVIYESGMLNFGFVLSDMDTDGNPIGLAGTLTTGDTTAGELQVILRHEPLKTATGATGGETDVDVSFPISVQ